MMVLHSSRVYPSIIFLLLVSAMVTAPTPLTAADLKEEAARAYERYVQAAEARRAREQHLPDRFLRMDSLPEAERRRVWADLKRGVVVLDSLEERDESGRALRAPHSLITHYVGVMFIPGVSIDHVLNVVQDYNHYNDIYKPEIVHSRLLNRQGESFEAFFRIHKDTPWVNPTFNINSRVTYSLPDARHASSYSLATRIAQVENAGQPDEHEDAVGHDGGYLWRLNSYWRIQEKDGGVAAEWEVITLSRSIPVLVRWLVQPLIEHLAGATLRESLEATRKEVRKRAAAAHPSH